MIEPDPGRDAAGTRARYVARRDLLADRHPVDPQPLPPTVVRLDQRPHRVPAGLPAHHPRCRPDPALEPEADHARAAADAPLGDRPGRRRSQRPPDVLRPHVHPVDVVQDAVVRLGDDGQAPPVAAGAAVGRPHLGLVRDQRVAHDPDAVRVGDRDGAAQRAALAQPLQARHLAGPVQRVAPREDRRVPGVLGTRQDHRHARPHRPRPDDQRPLAGDQRLVAHPHAGHVRDRVERPRLQQPDPNAGLTRAHARPWSSRRHPKRARGGTPRGCSGSRASPGSARSPRRRSG